MGTVVAAVPLGAQTRAELVDRLARVTSLGVERKLAEYASGERDPSSRRPPQIGRSGSIVVALGPDDPPGSAQAIAAGLAALVDSAAPWALPFADSVVLFSHFRGADTLQALTGRQPLRFELGSNQSMVGSVQDAARTLSIALIARDSVIRSWAGSGVDLLWNARERNPLIIAELITGRSSSGRGCLSGRVESCAIWLGLDDRSTYTAEDARRQLRVLFPQEPDWLPGLYGACRQGDDDSCFRANIFGHFVSSDEARRSLFHFIAATYGPDATRRLLADHTGSIGSRITRATGKQPVELATEWRAWLFAEAHWRPVTAGVRETIPAIVVVGMMLGLAMRSGRWRL